MIGKLFHLNCKVGLINQESYKSFLANFDKT